MKKIKIALLFGGLSTEHEISLLSARNIVESLDSKSFEVTLVFIDKKGYWHLVQQVPQPALGASHRSITPLMSTGDNDADTASTLPVLRRFKETKIDAVFPILHGNIGEDGSIQGMLRLMDIPYVGPDVLGSAVGLDKDVSKRLLRESGVAVAQFVTIRRDKTPSFIELKHQLGLPFVIKPASCGSSVGISIAKNEADYLKGLALAFEYDGKVLIEEHLVGRELECGIMGNDEPQVSEVGELIPKEPFYSYKLKYLEEDGAKIEVPAKISPQIKNSIQEIAKNVFKILCCEGMARVDFFLTKDDRIIVNEINTIPGFTKMSMFPMLWEKTGVAYGELVTKLVYLAIERHERTKALQLDYRPEVEEIVQPKVAHAVGA